MHCESATHRRLTHREKEGIRILDPRGQLKAGDSESTLRSAIHTLARDNIVNIVLNLAEVPKIASEGLEALVLRHTSDSEAWRCAEAGRLNIEHLSLNVLTKLNTVFEVFVDEQDAVNSFSPI